MKNIYSFIKGTAWLLPFLLPLFATLYTFNSEVLAWEFSTTILKAIGIGLALSTCVWLISISIILDKTNAAIASGLLLFWIYYFESIRKTLGPFTPFDELFFRYKYLLPFFLILSSTIVLVFRKKKKPSLLLSSYLNVFLTALICMELCKFGFNYLQSEIQHDTLRETNVIQSKPEIPSIRPDVYFIVFDSRTSGAALRKHWTYSDSAFENQLKNRGFMYQENSHSNYITTEQSIAATLNMNYVDELKNVFPSLRSPRLNHKYISQSVVMNQFIQMGYDIYNYSCFDVPHAKRYYESSIDKPFALRLWYKTFFGKIFVETNISMLYETKIFPYLFPNRTKSGNLKKMQHDILAISKNKKRAPAFVYAHFMIPHFPFVYRRDGTEVSVMESLSRKTDEKFLDQLIYSNVIALNICDSILKESKGDAVIILQGDHGYRFLKDKVYSSSESGCILNAWYLPGKEQKQMSPFMTPVNNFRFLFDSLFNQHWGLIPDKPFKGKAVKQELD